MQIGDRDSCRVRSRAEAPKVGCASEKKKMFLFLVWNPGRTKVISEEFLVFVFFFKKQGKLCNSFKEHLVSISVQD